MNKAKLFTIATVTVALAGGAFASAHKSEANIAFCDGSLCTLSPYSTIGNGILVSLPSGMYAENALTNLNCGSIDDCLGSIGVVITRAYFNP